MSNCINLNKKCLIIQTAFLGFLYKKGYRVPMYDIRSLCALEKCHTTESIYTVLFIAFLNLNEGLIDIWCLTPLSELLTILASFHCRRKPERIKENWQFYSINIGVKRTSNMQGSGLITGQASHIDTD